MRGVLLRSGRSEHFTALGETGQPVYRAALQIREAIRRKYPDHPELIEHLAIPQSDELGSTIDWYSDRPGDVIPWGSATEQERAPARAQLEVLQSKLNALSDSLLGLDANGQPTASRKKDAQGDNAIFGKLLTCVVPFPDENFVYLVNGRPVLTFWGFIHAGAERSRQPLHCLYPRTAPSVAPVATPPPPPAPAATPIAPAAAAPVAAITRSPWWRNWRWWLALLLLLLLIPLLLGLRGCIPGVNLSGAGMPDLGSITSTTNHQTTLPNGSTNVGQLNGNVSAPSTGQIPSAGAPVVAPDGQADAGSASPQTGAQAPAPAPETTPEAPKAPTEPPAPEQTADNPPTASSDTPQDNHTPPAPPQLPDEQPQAAHQPNQLSIPADAADGNADFLNGKWAGSGIQEAGTGKSLRMNYDFQNGKGQATVSRGDGVRCQAPVSAAMQGGQLSINSADQAACDDGSRYDLPQVDCKPNANGAADCTGNYGAQGFPMLMNKAG